jgi:hypothetical protein
VTQKVTRMRTGSTQHRERPEDTVALRILLPRYIKDKIKHQAGVSGHAIPAWCIDALHQAARNGHVVECDHPLSSRAGGICWAPGCHATVEWEADGGTTGNEDPED